MELSRQEYPALVAYLQPNEASTVITDRLKAINKLNTDIADWLQERRKLEESYVLGLRRLARRQQPDASSGLGIFELPWRRLVSATEALAQSHETLAQEIEVDVERPLKEYASKNRDMQTMTTMHSDLMGLAKEIEAAQKRVAKLKSKPGRSSAANSALEEAKTQWESRAPFVLEKLQAVDEHRVNHLRDVLTQLQTHEVDQIERNRQNAEACLNALLTLDSADEIKIFAIKVSDGRSTDSPAQDRTATLGPSASSDALPAPPRIQDDASSQTPKPSSQGRPSMASSEHPRDQTRHTAFGGLKRLGTVMGRRRSVALPSGASASGEKKFRFGGFRKNDSSRSFRQLDNPHSTDNGLAPVRSVESSGSRGDRPQNQSVPENIQITTTNGATIPEATPEQEAAQSPAPVKEETKPEEPQPKPQIDAEGYSTRPETVDEISRIQREAAAHEESGVNLTIRDEPIKEDESQALQAMSEVANTLRLKAQQTGISRGTGTLRGRREVRNTIFIPNPASPDSPSVQGLSPAISPGIVQSPLSAVEPPPKSVASAEGNQEDHPISDNASIQSSHTLHSLSGPISHPELRSPGLNASVVEKLSVMISGGTVTRSYVVGELAMAYNPDGKSDTSPETQLVCLENFHILERVAANPQFVTEAQSGPPPPESDRPTTSNGQEKKGEYAVSLAPITGPAPSVAFKYQIHLDPSNLSSYCPVIFTPVWNEEKFQASVIITYAINPNFALPEPATSMTLKNLTLTVSLDLNPVDENTKQPRDAARAVGAVMYPNTGALFRRKASAVVWKIPELTVNANEDGKFLARFTSTASWPRGGKVDAKFDFTATDNSLRLGVSTPVPETTPKADPFSEESNNAALSPSSTPAKEWKPLPTEWKLAVARYVSS